MEQRDGTDVPQDFTASLLDLMGQLVDLLRTHAPSGSAAIATVAANIIFNPIQPFAS